MRGLKTLVSTTALLAGLALAPAAHAQISINIGVQPVCSYGYYGYAPYACAPMGYYGSGYFYNGIFVGMGPWAGWGYGHGWGSHRFNGDAGGRYHGGMGRVAYSGHSNEGGRSNGGASNFGGQRPDAGHRASPPSAPRGGAVNREAPHAGGALPGAAESHASAPRGGASHEGGGQAHGGGGHPGGENRVIDSCVIRQRICNPPRSTSPAVLHLQKIGQATDLSGDVLSAGRHHTHCHRRHQVVNSLAESKIPRAELQAGLVATASIRRKN